MIYPSGYLPYQRALGVWLEHMLKYQEKLENQNLSDFSAVEDSFEKSVMKFSEDAGYGLFVYVFGPDGRPCRIIESVLECFEVPYLEGDFPSLSYEIEMLRDGCDAEEYEFDTDFDELWRLTRYAGLLFPFLNPFHSTIDCSGAEFISSLMAVDHSAKNFLELEWCASAGTGRAILDQIGVGKIGDYMLAKDLSIDKYSGITFLENPFQGLRGESVFFGEDELRAFLHLSYPLSEKDILRTVSAEKEAESKFLSYMGEDPGRSIVKDVFKRMFCQNLGARASDRVWQKVREEYPHLGSPGRRPKVET